VATTYRCWCNPPFSRSAKFSVLCHDLAWAGHIVIQVAKLVPETRWWIPIWEGAAEVWVLDRRIRFVHPDTGGFGGSPSHAHAIVVWLPGRRLAPMPTWRRCQLGPDQGVTSWSL